LGIFSGLFSSPKESTSGSTPAVQQQQQPFSCDKCTAKFTGASEYEMHMQLHRTLEAQSAALHAPPLGSAAAHHSAMYPFNLLSHLTGGNPTAAGGPLP